MKKLILATSLIVLSLLSLPSILLAAPTPEVLGPTATCDNLKDIADLLRNEQSVTLPQMMITILKNNPQAFYRDNVNGLIQNSWLYIPTDSEAQQESPEASKMIIDKQNIDWSVWLTEIEKTNPDLYKALHPSSCSTQTLQSINHRIRQTTKPVVLLYVEPATTRNPLADPTVIESMTSLQQQISTLLLKNQELQNQLDQLKKATPPTTSSSTIPQPENQLTAVQEPSEPTTSLDSPMTSTPIASSMSTVRPHIISFYVSGIKNQVIQWVNDLSHSSLLTKLLETPYWLLGILLGSLVLLCLILWWTYGKWSSCRARDKSPMAIPLANADVAITTTTPAVMKDYSEYAGSDLAATKLDLAKAYIDMEEWGRAKDMLKNVLETGNKAQKAEAENLFKEMVKK